MIAETLYPGRCGIHEFTDEDRARRPCEVCAENHDFIRSSPVLVKRASHHRPATDAQKSWFASAIKIAGERNRERGGKLP